MNNNYFVEKCNLTAATVQNIVFNPFCTSSSKNRIAASENFMPKASENNKTKMSESMS